MTHSPKGTYEVRPSTVVGQSHFTRIVIRNADGVEQTMLNTVVRPAGNVWDDATQTMIVWVDETSGTYGSKREAADAVRALRALGYTKAKKS